MLSIVDSDSGEVLREVGKGELYDFTKHSLEEYLQSTNEIYMPSFSKIDNRIFTDVNTENYRALSKIISMVNSNDGILRIKSRRVSKSTIIRDIGGRYQGNREFLQEMLDQDVLKEFIVDRRICYVMNPYLCSRGRRVKSELYEMFKESEWNRATVKRNNIKHTKTKKNEQDGLVKGDS